MFIQLKIQILYSLLLTFQLNNKQDPRDENVAAESQTVPRKKSLKRLGKENVPPEDGIFCLRSDASYIPAQRFPEHSMVPTRQRISRAVKSETLAKFNLNSVVLRKCHNKLVSSG